MLKASQIGAILCPPSPAFYTEPQTVDDIVDHSVARILDLFDIETSSLKRWQGNV